MRRALAILAVLALAGPAAQARQSPPGHPAAHHTTAAQRRAAAKRKRAAARRRAATKRKEQQAAAKAPVAALGVPVPASAPAPVVAVTAPDLAAPVEPVTAVPAAPAPEPADTPAPAPAPTTTPTPLPHTLGITEREFTLTLSRTLLGAGAITIQVLNRGEDAHDLRIDDAGGGARATWDELASGDSAAPRDVTLAAGTFRVYCTLPGHAAAGMDTSFTVSG